jgi:hypothetical protein
MNSLGSYCLAATAAGVATLALAEPADAKVVITTNINIPISGVTQVDLNHDGVEDITFSTFRTGCHGCSTTDLYARGAIAGNEVQGKSGVSALARSAKIGPSHHFSYEGEMIRTQCFNEPYFSSTCNVGGDWKGVPANRFVGVKFLIEGKTHYGWIRVTVKSARNATITEYGYETIANKMVKAGLKSNTAGASLGMLGLGVDGLSMWRKDESLEELLA